VNLLKYPMCRSNSRSLYRSVLKQSAPGHHVNGWDQCWTGIVFFFHTIRVWVFDIIFDSDTIWVYIPCKNLHT